MPPNHIAARLSDLDLQIVHSVPPGGNWKDVPVGVPSQRLAQIRTSYQAGEGSRSTYYGRLHPDRPAYTINTYFARPGNGCHIHYAQDRVLTPREAARLQTFPDSFEFLGGQGAVATQIGNAVPPLLAFQVAKAIGAPRGYVDLFAGAGGLSLGFSWAGWKPLVASDIDPTFLRTYAKNIHERVVAGDLREDTVFKRLLTEAKDAMESSGEEKVWVLGGPPCQGFSTAGNRRSMEDERNHLFHNYRAFLDALRPDGFVFENVSGLLNMEGGRVFELVRSTLSGTVDNLAVWHVHSEKHAVPQRRSRVLLIGWNGSQKISAPETRTADPKSVDAGHVAPWVSVAEAIDDLPPLDPGGDGTESDYVCEPRTEFQRFVRGLIGPAEYLDSRAGLSGMLIPA